MSKLKLFLLALSFSLVAPFLGFADDTLTITTYYPSPYGVYNEMRAKRIAIGDDYIDNTAYCWEGECTNTVNTNADLVVEGNVGIGTTNPAMKLHIYGDGTNTAAFMNGNVGIGTTNPGAKLDILSLIGGNLLQMGTGANGTWRVRYDNYNLVLENDYQTVPSFNSRVTFRYDGSVGIGTTNPQYTLAVVGTAYCTSGAWSGSDLRWKKDITPLPEVLSKIVRLKGVKFNWRQSEFPQMRFTGGPQIGFIAQDVEPIFPELVTTDNNGYKGISYERFVPVLTEAIKEQQSQINALKQKITALEARLNPEKS